MSSILFQNDNEVSVTVTDQDGAAVTGRTVTAQVYEADRTTTVGSAISMTEGDAGVYTGNIPDDIPVTLDEVYWINVIVAGSPKAEWWERARARLRWFGD